MTADSNFVLLLKQLTVTDANIRQAAERQFDELKSSNNVEELLAQLLNVATDKTVEEYVRQLSCVLLRRLLIEESESFYLKLPSARRGLFKDALLDGARATSPHAFRLKIGELAAELAGTVIENEEELDSWSAIAIFGVEAARSSDKMEREIGLTTIGYLSLSALNAAAIAAGMPAESGGVNLFIQLLDANLSEVGSSEPDPSPLSPEEAINGKLAVLSMQALCTILVSMNSEAETEQFSGIIHVLLHSLQCLVQLLVKSTEVESHRETGDEVYLLFENMCTSFIESMVEIAEDKPLFFGATLHIYLEPLMEMIESADDNAQKQGVSSSVKFLILEFLVTVCCAAVKRVRKYRGPDGRTKYYFAQRVLPVCMRLMSTMDDGKGDSSMEKWAAADTIESINEKGDNSSAAIGEESFGRICVALGCKSTYTIVSSLLAPYITSSEWMHQCAALQAIGCYMEVSAQIEDINQLQLHRKEVSATLLMFVENSHPRVRCSAYVALHQFLLCHGSALEESLWFRFLITLLTSTVNTDINPARVRRAGLIVLMSLVEAAASDFVEKHIIDILQCIITALQQGPVIVQDACLAVLTSIAGTTQGMAVWQQQYSNIMPMLKALLQHAQQQQEETLWTETLECAAIIGEAAGRESFYADAIDMMNSLIAMQAHLDPNSDSEMGLMKAWVRIARTLGADFLPYMPLIMQKLFSAMNQDVTVSIDASNIDELEERSDIEMIETDNQGWIAVRTAAVEEQSSACQLIILLAEKLQKQFYPYVKQSIGLFAKLITSPHDDIRSYSLVALPELVRVSGSAISSNGDQGRNALDQLASYVIGLLLKAIETESALEVIVTGLQSMKAVLVYTCTDWETNESEQRHDMNDSNSSSSRPRSVPINAIVDGDRVSIPFLTPSQIEAINQCLKVVLRDSIQRRAVLRAESMVSGGQPDDDDENDEKLFLRESKELHYHIAEVLGTLSRTHGSIFYLIFYEHWNDTVLGMCHPYCIEADRQFAAFVLSDVLEFTLNNTTAAECFEKIVPVLIEMCSSSKETGPRRTAAYAIGIACEKHPIAFSSHAGDALHGLASSIFLGYDEGANSRGECTDNAVAAIGIILEQMQRLMHVQLPYDDLWARWLRYLPLRADLDEGSKVIKQLLRLNREFYFIEQSTDSRFIESIRVMLEVIRDGLMSPEDVVKIKNDLHSILTGSISNSKRISFLSQQLDPSLASLLDSILTGGRQINENKGNIES